MSENTTLTAGEYISHHLTHLQSKPMGGVIDFSVVNLDSHSVLVSQLMREGKSEVVVSIGDCQYRDLDRS